MPRRGVHRLTSPGPRGGLCFLSERWANAVIRPLGAIFTMREYLRLTPGQPATVRSWLTWEDGYSSRADRL
jgi:hypothetical protein